MPPGLGFNSGLGLHGLNLNAGAGLGQQYTNYHRPQSYGYYYNPAQPAYAPAQSNYYAAPTVASYNPAQPSSYTTYRLVAPPSYTLRYTDREPIPPDFYTSNFSFSAKLSYMYLGPSLIY